MFARIAKVLTLERPHAVRVQGRQTFSKIQELDRLNALPRRRRPVLVRRWHLDSVSGKPVCAWEVEGPDLPPDLGIGPIQESQLLSIAVLPRRELWSTPSDRRDGHERRTEWLRSVALSPPIEEHWADASAPEGEAGVVADDS